MQKLRQYWLIILIGISVLGFAFYWYEWRPSKIIKDCHEIAQEKAKDQAKKKDSAAEGFNKDDRDAYYKWCLQKNGLR